MVSVEILSVRAPVLVLCTVVLLEFSRCQRCEPEGAEGSLWVYTVINSMRWLVAAEEGLWLTQPSGLQTVFAQPDVLPAPGRRWPAAKSPLSGAVLAQKPELDRQMAEDGRPSFCYESVGVASWAALSPQEKSKCSEVSRCGSESQSQFLRVSCWLCAVMSPMAAPGTLWFKRGWQSRGVHTGFLHVVDDTQIKSQRDTEWIHTKWFVGCVLTSANCSNARSSERLSGRRDAEQPGRFFKMVVLRWLMAGNRKQILVETLVSCCDMKKPFRVADAEQKSSLIILFGLLSDCADGSWPPVH